VGDTTNADQFAPLGPVQLNGSGIPTSPQLLEIMGRDRGNVSQGFARNFAYATLTLANGTYVQLANHSGATRVLYVNSLIVPSGATLDLNGFHVYARVLQINGTLAGGG